MNNSILDIKDILNNYTDEIKEALVNEAEIVSKEGVNKLKATSPHKTGIYAKGWRVKNDKGTFIIYNKNPGLTQLLEKPHVIKNQYGTWGTSTPKVHIKPVEEECTREYLKRMEKIIQSGGN